MLQRLQGGKTSETLAPCITLEEVQALCEECAQVRVEEPVQHYILNLVRATREDEELVLGASPRGTVALHRTAQAYAFLEGRNYVLRDDVKRLAPHVLNHRVIAAGGRRATVVMKRLLDSVAVP